MSQLLYRLSSWVKMGLNGADPAMSPGAVFKTGIDAPVFPDVASILAARLSGGIPAAFA